MRVVLSAALLAVAGVVTAPNVSAQAQGGLLYSTFLDENSTQCPPAVGAAVNRVTRQEVQYAEPPPTGTFSSSAFATQIGYCALLGDVDPDGHYWDLSLFGRIDALQPPMMANGQPGALDMHSLFLSSEGQVASSAGVVVAEAGDVFRILPGGGVETFLSMAQVQTALGITAPLNVDAVALTFDPQLAGIFLSCEAGQTAHFGAVADGDILWIPGTAITWGTGYDGCIVVQSVAANSGQLHLAESAVDALCASSGVGSCSGLPVTLIGDVNGLTWNDQAGELWFCGEYTLGCSVLSPTGGGRIVALNGRALGHPAPARSSNGDVGLVVRCGSSLNALSLVPAGLRTFVTDTPTPSAAPGTATIEAAGAPGSVFFLLNLLPDVPGPFAADPSSAWTNPCYPRLYPFLTHVGPSGVGCASFTSAVPFPFTGFHVTVQGVSVDPGSAIVIVLSAPSVIDF